MAAERGIKACCEHARLKDGLRFREFLDEFLVADAVVVNGRCPWNPASPLLSKVLHPS